MTELESRDVAAAAREARDRVADLVWETPLDYSWGFSATTGADVYFKRENLQYTGSFKLRGAANRLLTLTSAQMRAGCVAASSGNHGAAVAYAMHKLGIEGVIFVPEQTSPAKVEAIRRYGGDVRFFGTDGLDTEEHARNYAADRGMREVYGDVLRENRTMLKLCQVLGFTQSGVPGEPELVLGAVADMLAAEFAISGNDFVDTVELSIAGIDSVRAFGEVQKLLSGMSVIEHYSIVEVAGDLVQFRVAAVGGAERLRRALRFGGLIEQNDFTSNRPGRDPYGRALEFFYSP
jgi:hypothetical protein